MSTVVTRSDKATQVIRDEDSSFATWFREDLQQTGLIKRQVRVVVTAEPEGGYSALTPDLPGAFSEGETEDAALSSMRESLAALLDSYAADGESVPWESRRHEVEEDQKLFWIAVDVPAT